jgi:hypothetical protein
VNGPSGHQICLLAKAEIEKGKRRLSILGASRIEEALGSMPGTDCRARRAISLRMANAR